VYVLVAVLALGCRNPKFSVLAFGAFGDMALVAGDGNVDAFQRIFRGGMFLHTKCGGFPIRFRMA